MPCCNGRMEFACFGEWRVCIANLFEIQGVTFYFLPTWLISNTVAGRRLPFCPKCPQKTFWGHLEYILSFGGKFLAVLAHKNANFGHWTHMTFRDIWSKHFCCCKFGHFLPHCMHLIYLLTRSLF